MFKEKITAFLKWKKIDNILKIGHTVQAKSDDSCYINLYRKQNVTKMGTLYIPFKRVKQSFRLKSKSGDICFVNEEKWR